MRESENVNYTWASAWPLVAVAEWANKFLAQYLAFRESEASYMPVQTASTGRRSQTLLLGFVGMWETRTVTLILLSLHIKLSFECSGMKHK